MRTVVLAALGLLIASPSIPAQEPQPAAPTTWAAKLFADENGKIPPLSHNFGTVPAGPCSITNSQSGTSTPFR